MSKKAKSLRFVDTETLDQIRRACPKRHATASGAGRLVVTDQTSRDETLDAFAERLFMSVNMIFANYTHISYKDGDECTTEEADVLLWKVRDAIDDVRDCIGQTKYEEARYATRQMIIDTMNEKLKEERE
jgi:hypothetical protein